MSTEERQKATVAAVKEDISEEEHSRIRVELIIREYEQLRGLEQAIMQARYQIWAGAITLLSILAVIPGYAIIIGPLVLASMARYLRGGEATLRIIRSYLREVEKRYDHRGYEDYYDSLAIKEHGSAISAVRDTLIL